MIEARKHDMEKNELITIKEIEMITKAMAHQNPTWAGCDMKENKVDSKVLKKCLVEPAKEMNGRHAYHCIAEQASALFYMVLINKPFEKHNDRIAVVILAYVMDRHAQPMALDDDKLFDYVRWMKLAPEETKEEVITAFSRVLE